MSNSQLKKIFSAGIISSIFLVSLFIIIIFLIFPIWSYFGKMKPEKTFIPMGFTGDVKVYLDSPDGEERIFSNGSRILIIPDSGILHTQFKPNMGTQKIDNPMKLFFYYSKFDTIRLRTIGHCVDLKPSDSLNRDQIVVSGIGVGYSTTTNQTSEFYRVDSLWKVYQKCINWIEQKEELRKR